MACKSKKTTLEDEIKEISVRIEQCETFIQDFDLERVLGRKEVHSETLKQLTDLTVVLKERKREKADIEDKQRLLSSVPCGDQFPTCRFIKDAHEAGVVFKCCSPNLDLFDMTADDLIPECDGIVGGAYLIEEIMEEDIKVLTY